MKQKAAIENCLHSDAVIDWAISKRGYGRKKRGREGKKHHVSREEEKAMRLFGKWKGRKGKSYSNDSESSSLASSKENSDSSDRCRGQRRKRSCAKNEAVAKGVSV